MFLGVGYVSTSTMTAQAEPSNTTSTQKLESTPAIATETASTSASICRKSLISNSIKSSPFDLRLVDEIGNINTEAGRIEVFLNGQWGTVCDDAPSNYPGNHRGNHQNDIIANVVCRMLGWAHGNVRNQAFFGKGKGLILLDDVDCTGYEASLIECQYAPCHNCRHSEDVGVVCYNG